LVTQSKLSYYIINFEIELPKILKPEFITTTSSGSIPLQKQQPIRGVAITRQDKRRAGGRVSQHAFLRHQRVARCVVWMLRRERGERSLLCDIKTGELEPRADINSQGERGGGGSISYFINQA